MLWYNNPDSVEAIRESRLESRTTLNTKMLKLARTN